MCSNNKYIDTNKNVNQLLFTDEGLHINRKFKMEFQALHRQILYLNNEYDSKTQENVECTLKIIILHSKNFMKNINFILRCSYFR